MTIGGVNRAVQSLLRPTFFRKLVIGLGVHPRHADDAIQNAFVRFWLKNTSIDPSRGALALLTRFVAFEALNYRRRADGRREVPTLFDELDLGDGRPGPEDDANARELYEKLLVSIEQLDDRLKAVLVARALDGLSLADIAKAQGITEKTAENRLATARSALKALMKRSQAEPRPSRHSVVRALMLPLGWLDARTWACDVRIWFNERRGGVTHASRAIALGALLGGLPISDGARAADRSPFQPASRFSPTVSFAVENVVAGTKQVESAAASQTVASARATRPDSSGATATPSEVPRTTHDLEESLVMRASSLIKTGTPEAILEALELLQAHFDRYQDGRLAPERESLRRRIREPGQAPPTMDTARP
jgi:RNA polymerase sigma factor (sigma-70 family)